MAYRRALATLCLAFVVVSGDLCGAVRLDDPTKNYKVSGGTLHEVDASAKAASAAQAAADTTVVVAGADSVARADTTAVGRVATGAAGDVAGVGGAESPGVAAGAENSGGTAGVAGAESPKGGGGAENTDVTAGADETKNLPVDSVHVRHNRMFRDSIPISRMTAISLVAPGFSQLYNNQAWKLPILYASLGTMIYYGVMENKRYNYYKSNFDRLKFDNAPQSELDPWQVNVIKYNTFRQIFFAGAIASYIYFVGDGVVNYTGAMTSVKKATTLSTICPGAGQVYNGKFWKLPIVIGGLATCAFTIDWNSRGYERFRLAYKQRTSGKDDEFGGRYPDDFLRNLRNQYRRNRDMCIILTGVFYMLNIIDAHVDAHLKDYDISDNLMAVRVVPYLEPMFASGRTRVSMGMSMNVTF
ncbi:hypothetical protein FACS1894159_10210 [Bacteroidia bacterium]|nr:hypothetical protein FACS1894159_10210 [Bacteroidia bacterium]